MIEFPAPWHTEDIEPLTLARHEINIVRHEPLLTRVKSALREPPGIMDGSAPPPHCFLEAGAGSGSLSIALALEGYMGTAVERHPLVVEQARRNRARFEAWHFSVSQIDMRYWPRKSALHYRVCFSQGVIHHFDDKELEDFLCACFFNSTENFHSIPTCDSRQRDCSDERMLSPEVWSRRLRGLDLGPQEIFTYGGHVVCYWSHSL